MKWIITGGCGFIGCHAALEFINRGDEVVVIDNLSRKGSGKNLKYLIDNGLENFCQTDITDTLTINQIFSYHKDADAVLHLAAQVAVTWSVDNPYEDFKTNALGTFTILEATRKYLKKNPTFIYASTNKVYGQLDHYEYGGVYDRYKIEKKPKGIDENENLDFHSPYGCSKGSADQYVRDYHRIYGLNTVVLRQSCVYGTRQFGVEDQGWIAWFCIAAILNKTPTVYGSGRQVRDLLYIDDLIDVYSKCHENIDTITGEVFNVGGGPKLTVSILEFLDSLMLDFKKMECRFEDERLGDQKVYISDIRKISKALGWKPLVDVKTGVDLLKAWIYDNVETVKQVIENQE